MPVRTTSRSTCTTGAELIRAHLGDRATISEEQPVALGTAGALGALRGWLDGRAVLLTNADAYLPGGLAELVDDWDGARIRLLCKDIGRPSDFGSLRYVGACLLPWPSVAPLAPEPSGLYERVWRRELERGAVDLVDDGPAGDRLRHAGGLPRGQPGGQRGRLGRRAGCGRRGRRWCAAWSGPAPTWRRDERLVDTIRAGTRADPVTVRA